MNFTNMKIAVRLGLGFGLVMLLALVLAGVGIFSLERTQADLDQAAERERRVAVDRKSVV